MNQTIGKHTEPMRMAEEKMSAWTPSRTARLVRELRSLRVLLLHPEDQDGRELRAQLRRIGCHVRASWPPAQAPTEEVDVVLCAIRAETSSTELRWLECDSAPPVIAVLNEEDPATLATVLRLNAYGVIASPFKSFGLLCALMIARRQVDKARDKDKYVGRLEQRLASQRKITRAKAILMQARGISEDDAYKLIRERAMKARLTAEQIAEAVISANNILGIPAKD